MAVAVLVLLYLRTAQASLVAARAGVPPSLPVPRACFVCHRLRSISALSQLSRGTGPGGQALLLPTNSFCRTVSLRLENNFRSSLCFLCFRFHNKHSRDRPPQQILKISDTVRGWAVTPRRGGRQFTALSLSHGGGEAPGPKRRRSGGASLSPSGCCSAGSGALESAARDAGRQTKRLITAQPRSGEQRLIHQAATTSTRASGRSSGQAKAHRRFFTVEAAACRPDEIWGATP